MTPPEDFAPQNLVRFRAFLNPWLASSQKCPIANHEHFAEAVSQEGGEADHEADEGVLLPTAGGLPAKLTNRIIDCGGELRAGDRFLDRHHAAWRQWTPSAAQFALQELRAVTDFVDTLRARALEPPAPKPHDIEAN